MGRAYTPEEMEAMEKQVMEELGITEDLLPRSPGEMKSAEQVRALEERMERMEQEKKK